MCIASQINYVLVAEVILINSVKSVSKVMWLVTTSIITF